MNFKNAFEGGKKKLLTTLGGVVAIAGPSLAQGPNVEKKADQEFAKGGNTIEYKMPGTTSEVNNLKTYRAKTIIGATTPTGLDNKFENSNLKEADLIKIANKYGFSTASNIEFQSDLFKYVGQNHPEVMKKVVQKFGPAAAGLDANGNMVPDGNLGARTMEIIDELSKIKPTPPNKKEVDPFAAFAKMGERLFGPDQHAIADMYTAVRDTKNIENAGMLNTGNPEQYVLLRFIDGNTGNATGKILMLKASRIQQFSGTGTTVQSTEALNKLMSEAEQFTNSYNKSKTTYTYSPEQLAKGSASETNDLADLTTNKK